MLLQIANESLLDVLKLLDYSNLCNIQLVNNRLFQFINGFRNELPLKEFSQIEIVPDFDVRLSEYRRAVDIVSEIEESFGSEMYKLELNDELKERWISGIEKNISLYLSASLSEMALDEVDNFLIFIRRKGYRLHCNTGYLATRNFVDGDDDSSDYQHTINFLHFNIKIHHKLYLRVHTYFSYLLHFLLDSGNIKQVIFNNGPGHLTVDLHNLLVHHAESSKYCYTMIPKICFENVDDHPWPSLCTTAKLIEEGNMENGLYLTKYRIQNIHYSYIYFIVKIYHLFGAEEFKRFEIERIKE
ncbi:hypothetical protein Mgra_00000322 [Meloidogyne graminicola]|uniref:F-box domain-containing protein n=1 Tax=Meloidogyne graminicola TaxID=189291 RepID=A0A8T0A5A7_9BILA|nr:hypothetical protein Mgra_00000322 [Meloidogyne graminicola]